MWPGVSLMYLEGEVRGGRLTGRTILVIETKQKIDFGGSGNRSPDLRRFVSAACLEWEKRYQPADLVRVEHRPTDESETREIPTESFTSSRMGVMGFRGPGR
jgi:hypothetical protein